jgi:DNA-binding Lrp family transcriptional regulator
MDETDKKLLGMLQREVPIVARPWSVFGLPEDEALQRVRALKQAGVIRQISAIFDTRSLGYQSSLVAVKCDPAREAEVAGVINAHPGVSHNYVRTHAYNLWFTIAVSPASRLGLEKTVEILRQQSGAEAMRLLPTLRLFKIGVELDVEGTGNAASKGEVRYSEAQRTAVAPLTEREIEFVRLMQCDLPLEPEPFAEMGMKLDELQQIAGAMLATGRMRRFSAVLRHRQAGFSANAMGVWAVTGSEADIMATGERMAQFKAVSHCYLRPTYPDWPYNIFTMIHARTAEECNAVIAEIARDTGVANHAALYSTKEYKKTRVEYFTGAEAAWEAAR